MKKVLLSLMAAGLLLTSCENDSPDVEDTTLAQEIQVDMSDFSLYAENGDLTSKSADGSEKCMSMKNLEYRLSKNKGLAKKMYDIEYNTRKAIAAKKPNNPGGGNGGGGGGSDGGGDPPADDGLGTITIPVIVHVLYNNAAENISDAQIASQIAVLNEDFGATNNDINQVPTLFAGVVGDIDIEFVLSRTIRKATSRTSFGTNDAIKFDSQGGSNVVTPDTHLNMWVGDIGGGILGYAQFPGGSAATDGVVMGTDYFGTTGTATAPFDKGRTATHEVGHWLNLRHIWGDGRCNRDDFVSDTPTSDAPNYGCPDFPTNNCRSTDMTMNYMDYTNDACMYMFSTGQKERMRALFELNAVRDGFN